MSILGDSDLPFTNILNKAWSSVDDLVLCLGVILVASPIILSIGKVTQHYFRYSLWVGQSIIFLLLSFVFLFLLAHIAGETVMVSLLQGFGLGIGYALQPYIVALLSGCNYYFSGMIRAGDIILVDGAQYKVITNGILYIEASHTEKDLLLFLPNGYFSNNHLSKVKVR